jgi:dGTP triphosphohydrolase
MVKRARGSVRPGQRRPIDHRPATPAAASAASVTPKPSGLSDAELARAAELEAQLLAEERAAEAARKRTAERAPTREMAPGRAMAMEDEYAYVARDVKDIVRIAIILLAILFALYLIIDVFDVVKVG